MTSNARFSYRTGPRFTGFPPVFNRCFTALPFDHLAQFFDRAHRSSADRNCGAGGRRHRQRRTLKPKRAEWRIGRSGTGETRNQPEGATSAARENHGATRNRTDSWPGGTGPPTDLYERAGFRATEAPPSCYLGSFKAGTIATSSCCAVALAIRSPSGRRKSASTDMSCRVWATTRASMSSGCARPILKY